MPHNILDHSQYTIQLYVQDIDSGELYDFSKLCESVIWQTHRAASQPGSLEVLLKEGSQNRDFAINPGSFMRFGVNGEDYFYGRIQEVELLNSGLEGVSYRIMAHDSLSLLKSVESMYRPVGMSASEFFMSIVTRFAERGFKGVVKEPSQVGLDDYYFTTSSLYSMIKDTIRDTHVAEQGTVQYMIRDNLGTLEFRELMALRKPIILGDESFTDSYAYGVTINKQTYNVIKVIRDNEEIGMRDVWQRYDSNNIARWGWKQLVVEADDHMSDAEIRDKIDLHLEAMNHPRRTLKLTAIGINGLQAGDGIQIRADRANIDHAIWIESCTHVYTMQSHKMDLELYLFKGEGGNGANGD